MCCFLGLLLFNSVVASITAVILHVQSMREVEGDQPVAVTTPAITYEVIRAISTKTSSFHQFNVHTWCNEKPAR